MYPGNRVNSVINNNVQRDSPPAQPVDLGDAVLLLVGGMWPQPHMRRTPAHLLCRYSKATGEATVIELPADWRAQLR